MTARLARPAHAARPSGADLEIALLNNMPDPALRRTEGQFLALLDAASGPLRVRLRLLALPEIARGAEIAAHLGRFYAPIASLDENPPDALIITGAEPRTPDLAQESYWHALCRVLEFAAENTLSCFVSCLAAHAALRHFDGIPRRRLTGKCTGVFPHHPQARHPLTAGLTAPLPLPHSRWNDVDEGALAQRGYLPLLRAPEAGAGLFVKDFGSLFVFSQAHPEYGAEMLAREYRRDVRRFLEGADAAYPSLPRGTFPGRVGARLLAFRDQARARRDPALMAEFPDLATSPAAPWQGAATRLFANWLCGLAARSDRHPAADRPAQAQLPPARALASAGAAGLPEIVLTPASQGFATAGCALR